MGHLYKTNQLLSSDCTKVRLQTFLYIFKFYFFPCAFSVTSFSVGLICLFKHGFQCTAYFLKKIFLRRCPLLLRTTIFQFLQVQYGPNFSCCLCSCCCGLLSKAAGCYLCCGLLSKAAGCYLSCGLLSKAAAGCCTAYLLGLDKFFVYQWRNCSLKHENPKYFVMILLFIAFIHYNF